MPYVKYTFFSTTKKRKVQTISYLLKTFEYKIKTWINLRLDKYNDVR